MPKDDSQKISPVAVTPPIFVEPDALPPMPSSNVNNDVVNSSPVTSSTAAPIGDVILPSMPPVVTSSTPNKKYAGGKVIATILGLFLLVGGVGAGVYLTSQNQDIREKAFTNDTTLKDSCNLISVTITDSNSCPDIRGTSNKNDISTYSSIVEITNLTNQRHVLQAVLNSNFCNRGTGAEISCQLSGNAQNQDIELKPNERKKMRIDRIADRKTPSGSSCGSFQEDFLVKSIDGDTKCHGNATAGLMAWGACQTGTDCPSVNAACQGIKAYRPNWTLMSATELGALKIGDRVAFCATGVNPTGVFDQARFTINGMVRNVTTTVLPGTANTFCDSITIPATVNSFDVKAQIHDSVEGWK